ncbi:hypothetical protein [Mongoliitalea lutea]|uniref:Uncharacterized protein n=1 Tax=Mongoliitalea lutea TaxID=849756 RepID=A0A8J3CU19_9BACT|nr:hypothetical protein [Mongoliitalea lutea]GHB26232.1 hypothetical protein GCM10008106_03510 [Mongoliitalea lutea]
MKEDSESVPCDEEFANRYSNDPLFTMFRKDCDSFAVVISMGSESGGQQVEVSPSPINPVKDKQDKEEKFKEPSGSVNFDKKISYTIYHATDGKFNSYFYLNSLTGWAIKDSKAMEMLSRERMEGSVHQLINMEEKLMLTYMKMDEGAFFTKFDLASMGGNAGNENVPDFFKQARKTGETRFYRKFGFTVDEYEAVVDRKKVFIYLTEVPNHQKSGTKPLQLIGFSGLGYMYDGQGKAYLVLALMNDESLVVLTDLEDFQYTFNTAGYKGMNTYLSEQLGGGDLYSSASSGMGSRMEAQNKKNWGDFMDSNNLLALGNGYDSPEMTTEVFDLLIASFDHQIMGAQTALRELKNNSGTEARKRRAEAQCNLNCYAGKKSELEELKNAVLSIQRNPRLSEEQKRDTLDKFYEIFGETQSKPCDCWK